MPLFCKVLREADNIGKRKVALKVIIISSCCMFWTSPFLLICSPSPSHAHVTAKPFLYLLSYHSHLPHLLRNEYDSVQQLITSHFNSNLILCLQILELTCGEALTVFTHSDNGLKILGEWIGKAKASDKDELRVALQVLTLFGKLPIDIDALLVSGIAK